MRLEHLCFNRLDLNADTGPKVFGLLPFLVEADDGCRSCFGSSVDGDSV